ncbi:hypothetical protein MBANPS3_009786 [Mucor bainieri]
MECFSGGGLVLVLVHVIGLDSNLVKTDRLVRILGDTSKKMQLIVPFEMKLRFTQSIEFTKYSNVKITSGFKRPLSDSAEEIQMHEEELQRYAKRLKTNTDCEEIKRMLINTHGIADHEYKTAYRIASTNKNGIVTLNEEVAQKQRAYCATSTPVVAICEDMTAANKDKFPIFDPMQQRPAITRSQTLGTGSSQILDAVRRPSVSQTDSLAQQLERHRLLPYELKALSLDLQIDHAHRPQLVGAQIHCQPAGRPPGYELESSQQTAGPCGRHVSQGPGYWRSELLQIYLCQCPAEPRNSACRPTALQKRLLRSFGCHAQRRFRASAWHPHCQDLQSPRRQHLSCPWILASTDARCGICICAAGESALQVRAQRLLVVTPPFIANGALNTSLTAGPTLVQREANEDSGAGYELIRNTELHRPTQNRHNLLNNRPSLQITWEPERFPTSSAALSNHYGAGSVGTSSSNSKPCRTCRSYYLAACGFGGDSDHAIEWTMGTMMRDQDALYMESTVDREDNPKAGREAKSAHFTLLRLSLK